MKDAFDDGRARVLTEKQCAYLGEWVRDESDELAVAVGRDFLTAGPEEQRATLAHELLHPHFYRVTRLADRLIETELGKRTEAIISTAVRQAEELTIERLAHAIAVWLPKVKMPDA
jgi:hypothetical protein